MDRQVPEPQGDDDFLESLRQAAARSSTGAPTAAPAGPRPRAVAEPAPAAQAVPLVSSRTADALRDLEAQIGHLVREVRALNESRDRLVADVADAVVARLDARWARALAADEKPGS